MAAAGKPLERLAAHLESARRRATGLRPALTDAEVDRIAAVLMDPDSGFHARRKVFTHWQLVAEIAPLLYGHDPAELERVMTRVFASALVVPLVRTLERALLNLDDPTQAATHARLDRALDAARHYQPPDQAIGL